MRENRLVSRRREITILLESYRKSLARIERESVGVSPKDKQGQAALAEWRKWNQFNLEKVEKLIGELRYRQVMRGRRPTPERHARALAEAAGLRLDIPLRAKNVGKCVDERTGVGVIVRVGKPKLPR